MFNLIDIYSFISASGCVGMGSSALLFPGPIMLLKKYFPFLKDEHNAWVMGRQINITPALIHV
jgi:hypothetical protein